MVIADIYSKVNTYLFSSFPVPINLSLKNFIVIIRSIKGRLIIILQVAVWSTQQSWSGVSLMPIWHEHNSQSDCFFFFFVNACKNVIYWHAYYFQLGGTYWCRGWRAKVVRIECNFLLFMVRIMLWWTTQI